MKLTTELSHGKHVINFQIKLSSECTMKGNEIETIKIVECTPVFKPLNQNFTCFYILEVAESRKNQRIKVCIGVESVR